ncbi:MAG: lysophospholipid acyltransferase family protein [Candidatus Eisenbacteria bacterium]
MKAMRYPWWMPLAAAAAARLVLVLGATWRVVRVRLHERDTLLDRGERCIFAFWHARLLPLVFTHRRRSIAVLIGRHRDGELIARIITRLGFLTGRGSSTRGGEEGIREMLRHAEDRRLLALTPDGPRGPAERVKPGLVYLASRTGCPVIPVATAARHAWTLDSWDRFRIPQPFARVVVAYGAPIAVPARLRDDEVEVWRVRIEAGIRELTAEVERNAAAGGAAP